MLNVDVIEARCKAAAAPPWRVVASVDEYGREVMGSFSLPDVTCMGDDFDEEDAEFISHAVEDIPALIAEVRRLRIALG